MLASLVQKLRCPRTHATLRQVTQEERVTLKLKTHEEALVTFDLKHYYVIDQGLPTLLADAARKWPLGG